MQCTPAPPSYLDLHPKSCQNPLDCFPNLCCQEKGKKYCRPPRRSLLALVADVGQVTFLIYNTTSNIHHIIFRKLYQKMLQKNLLNGYLELNMF